MTTNPEVRPEVRAAQVESVRTLGAAFWRPTGRTTTLTNTRTGASWVRDVPGRWRPARPAASAARQAAELLADEDQVDAVCALLRQQFRPWGELLEAAVEAAVDAGVNPATVRAGKRRVAERMNATERRPHRVVRVVEDVEALAASWYADAAAAVDPAWAVYCREQARQAEVMGEGVFLAGVFDDRAMALVELVKQRDMERPGQSWRVEPAGGAR